VKNRREQIKKSIRLIGWYATKARIQSEEDRKLFNEIEVEYDTFYKAEENKKLRKAGISF